MSYRTDQIDTCGSFACSREDYRLRVILADGSVECMETILALLELHSIVDLIGRAANFEETIELVVNHQPDLVLVDLDIPLVNLVIPTIILCKCADVRVVGLSQGVFPSHANDPLMAVDALIHKQDLCRELVPVISALYGRPQVVSPISAQPM
jgi:DNA-binding NarL/FixJ family response regulator